MPIIQFFCRKNNKMNMRNVMRVIWSIILLLNCTFVQAEEIEKNRRISIQELHQYCDMKEIRWTKENAEIFYNLYNSGFTIHEVNKNGIAVSASKKNYFIEYNGKIKEIPFCNSDEELVIVNDMPDERACEAVDQAGNRMFYWKSKNNGDYWMEYLGYDKFMVYEYNDPNADGYTIVFDKNGKELYTDKVVPSIWDNKEKIVTCNIMALPGDLLFISKWDSYSYETESSSILMNIDGKVLGETEEIAFSNWEYYDWVTLLNDNTLAIIGDWRPWRDGVPFIEIYDLNLNCLGKILYDEEKEDKTYRFACNNGYLITMDHEAIYVLRTAEVPKDVKDEIVVYVNEKKVAFDVEPVQENDRVMVPMRGVFEALGAKVDWEEERNTAIAENDGVVIEVTIGSHQMLKNGEEIELDTAARMEGDRTLVPLRAVSEALGAKVEWEALLQTVYIEQ